MLKRTATAQWEGGLNTGQGTLITDSATLAEVPFSYQKRFGDEDEKGTNPEELIAAAQASCFAMALSAELEKRNFHPESIEVQATVVLEKKGEWTITGIELQVEAEIPEASKESFEEAVESTKKNCPVSRVLNAPIRVETTLLSKSGTEIEMGPI
jgi:osmotically inducible protein OsmC